MVTVIDKALTRLTLDACFYAGILLNMRIVEDAEKTPLAATDGKNLWLNPTEMEKVGVECCEGTLVHEAIHAAHLHPLRRGDRDSYLWNVACDLSVNEVVIDGGWTLPKGVLINKDYIGMTPEAIYDRLVEEVEDRKKAAQQQPSAGGEGEGESSDSSDNELENDDEGDEDEDGDGESSGEEEEEDEDEDGSGAGDGDEDGDEDEEADVTEGRGDPNEDGEDERQAEERKFYDPEWEKAQQGQVVDPTDEDGDPLSEAEKGEVEAEMKVTLSQAERMAKMAGQELGNGMQRIVDETLRPEIDWRELIQRFFRQTARENYTWTRPSRRLISSHVYLPAVKSEGMGKVVIVRDTSGSIGMPEFNRASAEVGSIIDELKPEVVVIDCSDQVEQTWELTPGEEMPKIGNGCGGTNFAPAFDWIAGNVIDADCIVYFTDLYTTGWGDDPGVPVLWIEVSGHGNSVQPPFGEVVRVRIR